MRARPQVTPPLDADTPLALSDLVAHLAAWRSDIADTGAALETMRGRVEQEAHRLECPQAAFEYLDFFIAEFDRLAGDLESLCGELSGAVQEAHAARLREMAAAAAAEERRVVIFRDRWINKPLPHEQLRPLLTEIATLVRDQLADCRALTLAASGLSRLEPSSARRMDGAGHESERPTLDRRALFSRLLRPPAGQRRDG